MSYDYLEALIDDVKEYLTDNYTPEELRKNLSGRTLKSNFADRLNDELWTVDSVTGNGSGSYTYNTCEAAEYVADNLDLLADALEEFGSDLSALRGGAESCDVSIRCYLLWEAIQKALDQLEEELDEEELDEE